MEPSLRAMLFRYVRNASDVEDLLQGTYERLFVAGASPVENVRHVPAFIRETARNLALNFLRARGRAVPMEALVDLDIADDGMSVEDEVNAEQELALFNASVARLPAQCRRVYVLRKVHGYSWSEIARLLQISKSTVHQHVSMAAATCERSLIARDVSSAFLKMVFRTGMRRKGRVRT
jgi:RNA polymerase sigma-70 factor (ECF subfamily)